MGDRSPTPKKGHSDSEDLESLSKAELIARLKEQEQYIKQLDSKRIKLDKGEDDVDLAERLKQQQKDAARRENTLVHRLTTKEQELQDYINQITELKQAQTQGTTQLKSMLLDPAVNIVFQRMTKEMEESQEKLKQTQNELSAWKFTPDSQTGKRLMARCQMLLQENEELGKTIASGKTAKLEGEIALQKTLVTEIKNSQSELDEFLGDLDEDVEGMQTMIYTLQQQLRECKEQITVLEEENSRLRSGDTSKPSKPFATLSKKLEKLEEIPVKTENTNQNAYSKLETDYSAMETGYYQEKTDSDFEAEYNYEGVYENDDKYQEEFERQQSAEAEPYEYGGNGYKQYDEDYDSQDYRSSFMETDANEQEAMETGDTHKEHRTRTSNPTDSDKHHHTPPAKSYPTHETSNDEPSSTVKNTSHSHSPHKSDSARQHKESRESEGSQHNMTKTDVRMSESGKSSRTEHSNASSRKERELTPEKTRIPSPRPTSKISPKKRVAARAQESGLDGSRHSETTANGSPNKDRSPGRNCKNSPVEDNHSGSNQSKQSHTEAKEGGEVAHTRSKSPAYDKSPGSAESRDREPVLQKFLNGVTSTVDDIEDL